MFTWVEIKSNNIRHNLRQFRKMVGKKTLLMPVVKSNAYGHGILGVAKICDQSPEADRICVVNLEEALELKKNKIKKPIMILSFYELDEKKIKIAAKNKIIFPIYSERQISFLNKAGERVGKKIKVHLKIDTGASRMGILPKDAQMFAKKIKQSKFLDLEGIWSHFASSEEDKKFTKKQIKIFNETIKTLTDIGINPPIKHMACSAASALYPKSFFNGVRLGLSLYGIHPIKKSIKKIRLKPALSWHTKIIQVKDIPTGAKIGYGGTFTVSKPTKIAIIPVGYWDGFDRKFSNRAFVIIKGQKCPIRGRICMNLCMVEIKNHKIKVGDEAIIIGKGKNKIITAENLAGWAETINYEIIDRINPLIPRIFK
ncbi:MAG: alanine racemase [Patescibacteria group bacterium]|nr:alanine racemase [Patescibacteria group bacterium]